MSQNRKLETLQQRPFFRFLLVGATITAVLYVVYFLLYRWLKPNLAFSIGFIVSFIVNYILTSLYTFKSQLNWKNALGFATQQGVNYLIQIICLNLFLWIGVPEEWAPFPVFVVLLPTNYFLLRYVFKGKVMK